MTNVDITGSDPIFKSTYLFKQFEVDHEEDFVSRTYCLIYYLLNVSFLQ